MKRSFVDTLVIATDVEELPRDIDQAIASLHFLRVLRPGLATDVLPPSRHYYARYALDAQICETAAFALLNPYSTASRFIADRRASRQLTSEYF